VTRRSLWWIAAVLATSGCFHPAPKNDTGGPEPVRYDVIVRHGTIVDGTGAPRFRADLGVLGQRIAKIGDLSRDSGAVSIDATGLVVAPGFINVHSHAEAEALPTAENMLTQGVTTEILNADGGGPVDIGDQLSRLASPGLAVNIGAYAGFNAAWENVVGNARRRATGDEIERMRRIILENLRQGAWGVSSGLDYTPAAYATTAEVISVVSVAKDWRTNFPNHERLTPESHYSSRVGIAETLEIGAAAGLAPVITHMKAQGIEQKTSATLLGMMTQSTDRGVYASADVYPYLAGMTSLGALTLPKWVWEGSKAEILARVKDPGVRARAIAEGDAQIRMRFGGPSGVYLVDQHKQLTDMMRELGVTSGAEAILQLAERDQAGMSVLTFGAEEDLRAFLQYPNAAVACDCGARRGALGHPREYGTFPRVLGRYVRNEHVLTWENAIRKMTGLPATMIGMVDRGFIAVGVAADVVVFDTASIIDHATYEKPSVLSEGVTFVLVGGQVALRDGRVTGARGGQALRRTVHMPTRPMTGAGNRRVAANTPVVTPSVNGTPSTQHVLAFDIAQGPNDRRASGHFRLADRAGQATIEVLDFGVLQSTSQWASFSGRARLLPSGEMRAVVVTIERADPSLPEHPASVTADVEGERPVTMVLPSASLTLTQRP
jgi:N-acyl-D-aspartate/D-glutamate deacylase